MLLYTTVHLTLEVPTQYDPINILKSYKILPDNAEAIGILKSNVIIHMTRASIIQIIGN
jgi:hypothetical protein